MTNVIGNHHNEAVKKIAKFIQSNFSRNFLIVRGGWGLGKTFTIYQAIQKVKSNGCKLLSAPSNTEYREKHEDNAFERLFDEAIQSTGHEVESEWIESSIVPFEGRERTLAILKKDLSRVVFVYDINDENFLSDPLRHLDSKTLLEGFDSDVIRIILVIEISV